MIVKDMSIECEFHPVLTALLFNLDELYHIWGDELIITSGSEQSARHSRVSLHYAVPGQAVDIRVWSRADVPDPSVQLDMLAYRSAEFCFEQNIPTNWIDIILEATHIHIEYQPKRRDS